MVGEEKNPFRKALEWFEGGRKWAKRVFRSGDRACSLGALSWAEASKQEATYLDDLAVELFPQRAKHDHEGLLRPTAQFNDHPDTTWEDIEALFEKAAVRWEERVG